MSPQRIQRRRTKGWRMPEGAVYVGRPTLWGNPYVVGQNYMWLGRTDLSYPLPTSRPVGLYEHALSVETADRDRAVMWFRAWIKATGATAGMALALAGRDLVCWCPLDQPCHADVLLEIANGEGRGVKA